MGRWSQYRHRGTVRAVTVPCSCDDASSDQFSLVVDVVLGVGTFHLQNLNSLSPCFESWSCDMYLDDELVEESGPRDWLETWTPIAQGSSGQSYNFHVTFLGGSCPDAESDVATGEVP